MNHRRGLLSLLSGVGLALFCGAQTANAQIICIDDFNTDQAGVSIGPGADASPKTSFQPGVITSIIGGERDMSLSRTLGTGIVSGYATGGAIALSTALSTKSSMLVQWDGVDGSIANANGLGSVSMLGGTVQLTALSDLGATINVTFITNGVGSTTIPFAVAAGGVYSLYSAPLTGGTADFSDIDSVEMFIDGTGIDGVDVQVDSLKVSTVPEPGAVALFLGASLTGTAFAFRRRK